MREKVLKYGTGEDIPKNAKYLRTIKNGRMPDGKEYVWHYYIVEVDD